MFLFDLTPPPAAPPAAPPAPAAPAAPPAAPAAAPAAPETGNPITRAIDAAKAALTGGRSLGQLASERPRPSMAPAAPAAPAAPTAPAPAGAPNAPAGQPRNPDGTFAAPATSQTPGEAPPAADADAEADPGAPPAEGGEGDQPDPALVVTLPAVRRDGDEPLSIVLESEEDANILRHNLKLAARAESLLAERESVVAQREEVEEFRTQMAVDPVGYILSEDSGLDDRQKINLALSVLTDEQVWARARSVLSDLLKDPRAVAQLRAEAKAERSELRDTAAERIQTQRELSRNARQINTLVERLTPEGYTEAQRDIFYRDCINDVKEYVRTVLQPRGYKTLDPRYLPQVLQNRLAFHGITPEQVQAAFKGSARPTSAPPAPPARSTAAPASGSPPAPPAAPRQPTGAELRRGAETRRAVAAAAPAGAGAPGSGVTAPPQGSTLKQAFKFAREHLPGGRPG